MVKEVKKMIIDGVYDQNIIFNSLYPRWDRHYSILRDLIAKVKNDVYW